MSKIIDKLQKISDKSSSKTISFLKKKNININININIPNKKYKITLISFLFILTGLFIFIFNKNKLTTITVKNEEKPQPLFLSNNNGVLEFKNGQIEKAMTIFESLIKSQSTQIEPSINLASVYYKFGKHKESIQLLNDITLKNPKNSIVLNNLAIFELKQGNIKKAQLLLKQATQMDLVSPEIYFNLATTYEMTKNWGKALLNYKLYLQKCESMSSRSMLVKKRLNPLKTLARLNQKIGEI